MFPREPVFYEKKKDPGEVVLPFTHCLRPNQLELESWRVMGTEPLVLLRSLSMDRFSGKPPGDGRGLGTVVAAAPLPWRLWRHEA